jgi:histidine ammonia-lyase
MLLALAVDAIRPALAHVAQLSDRRTGQLWDRLAADEDVFTPDGFEEILRYGSPLLRYAGAARAAEVRTMAGPATLDLMPLDLGVEDHGTMAPLAVRITDDALDAAEDVLAVELATAAATVGWRVETRDLMGPRTRAALDLVAATIAGLPPLPAGSVVHAAARELLFGPLLEAPRP